MVTVVFQRDGSGRVCGFAVGGHAGYAEAGQDIVCAAVSAITQTAVLGLEQFCGTGVYCAIEPGSLVCRLSSPAQQPGPAWYIVETMLLGLTEIAREHPKYLRINTQEV
ncbi:MAG: ribosomal-processing cysteine protease Prp [Bacillota bacterium]